MEFEIQTVTPNTRASIGGTGYGNVGAILQKNYSVIIDTSLYPLTANLFRKEIEKETSLQPKYLIFTHYHGDHTFGAQSYNDLEIISSQLTKQNIEIGYHDDWRNRLIEDDPITEGQIEVILPSKTFDKTFTIGDKGNEIIISHSGGHTSGSSYVYFPSEQVLFTGDLVFYKSFPYGADPTCDPDKWINQLKEFQKMNLRKVVPGHGSVIDSIDEITDLILLMEEMRKIIIESLVMGETPVLGDIPHDYMEGSDNRKDITIENWVQFYKAKLIDDYGLQ